MDEVAKDPTAFLFVIVVFLVFEGVAFGDQIAEESFANYEPDDFGGWDILGDIVSFIVGAATFLFNLLTFNIGDAPWWIRVPVSFVINGGLFWSVLTLIRGN